MRRTLLVLLSRLMIVAVPAGAGETGVDPAALIAGLDLPVLIVQGGNDLQVRAADAERLAAAYPAAELAILPGMNHVLKQTPPGDRAANLASYADPEMKLAPGLAEAVAGFILRER